jgi:predicted DNA-binding transcriptional regulator YafY
MSEVVGFYQCKSLLTSRGAVSAEELMAMLEIARGTLKRDIAKLRDQLHVLIRFDRDRCGRVFEQGHSDNELPGQWFSRQEILSLVPLQHLFCQPEPGLLGLKLKRLQERLGPLMGLRT